MIAIRIKKAEKVSIALKVEGDSLRGVIEHPDVVKVVDILRRVVGELDATELEEEALVFNYTGGFTWSYEEMAEKIVFVLQ